MSIHENRAQWCPSLHTTPNAEDTLKISEDSVFTILHEHLSMRKLLFEMDTALSHSRSKTTTLRRFRALFGAVSTQ